MNDADKPFIMYKRGWGNMSIVPRNAQGWRETILWMLLMVPVVGAFTLFAMQTPEPTGRPLYIALGLFFVAMLAWSVGGIWWMHRRAEVVDFEELLALKRERDAQRRRR